jgi:hypothetical protein
MAWNEKDFERYSSEIDEFEPDLDLLDTFASGFVEGWKSGPTASIGHWLQSKQGVKDKLGSDLNKEYGLEGTPAAFAPDEKFSDEHAKMVTERFLNRQSNELIAQQVSENHGFVGDAMNFAGNLTSGFVDPINLAAGVGTSMAVGKLGAISARKVFADVAAKTTLGDVAVTQLAENLASSLIVDAALVPIGDEALNQNVSVERRLMNVVGATLMGTAIGTPLDMKAVKNARVIAYRNAKQFGTQAEGVLGKSQQKAMMDQANGIKPNPDHVVTMQEMEWHSTRPDQQPYAHMELDAQNIGDQTFYIARDMESRRFDFVEEHGSGTFTMVDNYNLAHNRVQDIKNTKSGEVFAVDLKTKNILTDDMFDSVKSDIRESIKNVFDASSANKKARSSFLQRIAEVTDESSGILEYKDLLHEVIDDFHGVDSIDDIVNKALSDMGYDGYHSVGLASTRDDLYNAITLFDPKVFKGDSKGLMYIGKGKSKTNAAMSGVDGDKVFFNSKVARVWDAQGTQAFDPQHPDANAFMKPFQDTEVAEINRRNDVTQQIGYDEKAMKELNANSADIQEYDSARELLDSEAHEINAMKANKKLDKQTQDAIAIAESPNLARDAFDHFVNCKRG